MLIYTLIYSKWSGFPKVNRIAPFIYESSSSHSERCKYELIIIESTDQCLVSLKAIKSHLKTQPLKTEE